MTNFLVHEGGRIFRANTVHGYINYVDSARNHGFIVPIWPIRLQLVWLKLCINSVCHEFGLRVSVLFILIDSFML